MSKQIVVSTTNKQELCSALQEWTGRILSRFSFCLYLSHANNFKWRTKEGLRNGEIIILGDHWPIFLYAGNEYDPENPWKGLFRSTLLVCVGSFKVFPPVVDWSLTRRLINMYSHHRVRLKRSLRLRDPVMREFMGWPVLHQLLLPTSLPR